MAAARFRKQRAAIHLRTRYMRAKTIIFMLVIWGTEAGHAQTSITRSLSPDARRRIETTLRSSFRIPQSAQLVLGEPTEGRFPGYSSLPVTVIINGRKETEQFHFSSDGKALLRVQEFKLMTDPLNSIDLTSRPVRGNPEAPVTLVMFDDLQCPYCAQMHTAITKMIEQYGGRVRTIYKSFPLPNHSWGRRGAVAAECMALESGDAYWSFIDRIKQAEMDAISKAADPGAYIENVALQESVRRGIGEETFRSCLAGQGNVLVERSIKEGQGLGIEGTPTIFVNSERISGYVPESELRAAIDRQLTYESQDRGEEPKASAYSPR